MITQEQQLKLQAYLDNELGASDTSEVVAWLQKDAEARALQAELKEVSLLLAGNELEVKLPETREFYWSKIERSIHRQEVQSGARTTGSARSWLWRFVMPALGVAALVLIALPLFRVGSGPGELGYLHEIETPLEDTSAISFHSQSAGMTVVWVQSQAY